MRVEIVRAQDTLALRRAVLRPGTPLDEPMANDGLADAIHLAALEGGEVVGCCLIRPSPYPGSDPGDTTSTTTWQLRGMATTPDRRGTGIGARVLAAAVERAVARGATLVWCNARIGAERFYTRHGFTPDGPVFREDETGLPHVRMRLEPGREPSAPATSSERVERSDDRSHGA